MEKLTIQQAAVISAYTGVLIGRFQDMHQYIEKIMGRSVLTHELTNQKTFSLIKELSKSDFISINPEL